MSDYESKPGPMQAFNERLSRLEAAMRATNGSNGLESATIGSGGLTVKGGGRVTLLDANDKVATLLALGFLFQSDPDTAAAVQIAGGRLHMWGNRDENPDNFGVLMTDPGDNNYTRWFPPYSDGTGNENSITMQGRRPGMAGRTWLYSDGRTDIISPLLGLYELPTTSSGANLHLGMVGGEWTVAYVTSSARYKQDIVDAPIDPTAPLRWQPRWWRDRDEVAAIGDAADFHHGFIAEEIAEESPSCVRFDDEGRPDSLRQMHMLAEVVALCQAQQDQIADLTARLDALEGDQ